MNLNIFFPSKNERLEFIKKQFKIDKIIVDESKMTSPTIPELIYLKFKSSYQGIPGFWLEFSFHKTNQGKELFQKVKALADFEQIEEHVFFPKGSLKPKDLEKGWIKKYRLLREDYCEDSWNTFYKEIKAHIKSKRFDVGYYGLLVILKYNPFFLKKYKRFYQFEELAYHYEENGNVGKAIKCLKVHIILQPESVEPYLNMSSFYIINEMEEKAITICKEALEKNPNNMYLISNLVLALSNLGNYEYAVEYMRKIINKQPENSYYWKLLGDLLYEVEENQEAVECYQNALKYWKNKNNDEFIIDLYNGIAAAYYELESFEESAKYYKKVLKHYPTDTYVLLSLSQIYFYKLEEIKEALHYGKLLLEKAPENGYGHYQVGLIYMKLEKYEKAKWHLYRAKKIMPQYEPIVEAIKYLRQVDKIISHYEAIKGKKQ